MTAINDIFGSAELDANRLSYLNEIIEPSIRYIIAMTPRSGSSYLCDVMQKRKVFGVPGEYLNQQFIPNILKAIPATNPDIYLRNVLRAKMTRNKVSGIKASWFQFNNFISAMSNKDILLSLKYIYLTRQDLEAQAVSLYKATSTSVFHTNIEHDAGALSRLEALEYDYNSIEQWYNHIVQQELGWQEYFRQNAITPLHLTYEEIEEDVGAVLTRIADYLHVNPDTMSVDDNASIFRKIGDAKNQQWAQRFRNERVQKKYS